MTIENMSLRELEHIVLFSHLRAFRINTDLGMLGTDLLGPPDELKS